MNQTNFNFNWRWTNPKESTFWNWFAFELACVAVSLMKIISVGDSAKDSNILSFCNISFYTIGLFQFVVFKLQKANCKRNQHQEPKYYQSHHIKRSNDITQVPRTVFIPKVRPHILILHNPFLRPGQVHPLHHEFKPVGSNLFHFGLDSFHTNFCRVRPVEEVEVHDQGIGFPPFFESSRVWRQFYRLLQDELIEGRGADEEGEAQRDLEDAGVKEAAVATRLGVEFHFEFLFEKKINTITVERFSWSIV